MGVSDVSGIYAVSGGTSSSVGIDDVHARWRVEYRPISVTDLLNQYVTISAEPKTATKVKVEIVTGPVCKYGIDFTVDTNLKQVKWNGLALVSLLTTGDELRITYFEV